MNTCQRLGLAVWKWTKRNTLSTWRWSMNIFGSSKWFFTIKMHRRKKKKKPYSHYWKAIFIDLALQNSIFPGDVLILFFFFCWDAKIWCMKIDLKSTIELQNEKKLLIISVAAMMVAFCAALRIVMDGRLGAVIPVSLLAGIPVTLFILLQFPLLVEIFISTFGPGIFNRKMKLWYWTYICFSMQGTFSPFRVLEPKFLNDQLEFNFMDLMWLLFIWFCSRKVSLHLPWSYVEIMHVRLNLVFISDLNLRLLIDVESVSLSCGLSFCTTIPLLFIRPFFSFFMFLPLCYWFWAYMALWFFLFNAS